MEHVDVALNKGMDHHQVSTEQEDLRLRERGDLLEKIERLGLLWLWPGSATFRLSEIVGSGLSMHRAQRA